MTDRLSLKATVYFKLHMSIVLSGIKREVRGKWVALFRFFFSLQVADFLPIDKRNEYSGLASEWFL